MLKEVRHYGIMGMKWGHRKSGGGATVSVGRGVRGTVKEVGGLVKDALLDDASKFKKAIGSKVLAAVTPKKKAPETQAIIDKANSVLNNPKSTQKDVDDALKSIGVDPKTGKVRHTDPIYDKDGNDVSVKPLKRLFKEKGQSDKDFDAEVEAEMNPKPEKLVGKPVKTLLGVRTEAVYDSNGKDISSKPFGRPFKKKGQSDKDYDAEIDEENSDAPTAIAKRKVADLEMDRQAKIAMSVALATAGVVTVATYMGKQSLKRSADAAILAKYGPELFKKMKKG